MTKIDLRRGDFEGMHPKAKLFGFDEDKKLYTGDGVESINHQWTTWCACIGMLHLEVKEAQAVPEGFVEKTESNTHHYFKLKDWDEWTCIDGIKDAITSDYDINAIVEVECLEVIEINNKHCFALLAFGKRHGTEVKFFDTEEEAIEAQEPTND